MSRFTIFLAVIGFLGWVLLADYLKRLYNVDIDAFWMVMSTILLLLLISGLMTWADLRHDNDDNEGL